ncbi:sulfotransferase, partial [Prochlorococcus sp. AH-716-J21]|nr:sulfotransferase [Prochlorococcus sp. AH-716-J21]
MKGFGDNKNLNLDKFNHPKKDKDLFLKNKLDLAKNYFLSGDVLKAKKIYSQLINSGISSYDLFFSYALFSRNCSELQIAKKLLFQSISRYPTKVDHYILLAEILRLEKDFKKAKELLLIACKINPRNSNSIYNLSLLYRDLNDNEKALSTINNAIKLLPTNIVYKLLKADLLKDLGNFDESASILLDLYSAKNINDKKDILLMLSTVKRLDDNFNEAERILLETIQQYPNFSQAYLNLSDLYFEDKKPIKAKEIALKGLNVKPVMPEIYANLGFICRNLGEIDEAKKYLLKALSMNKKLFNCYENLSTFYDFSDSPKELEYLMNVPLKGLNQEDITRIYFSRAEIYHRQNKFSDSSRNYKLANDFKSRIYPSNKTSLIEKSIRIKEKFFSKKESLKNFNEMNPDLIFIVGMPRSGSTLLENILSLNQGVLDLGEIEILPEIMDQFDPLNKNYNPYEKYIEQLDKFYPQAKIATDKNLFNYKFCPVIDMYFKNTKIIFCLRNPLDNILSIYRSNFNKVPFSTNIEDIAEIYVHHYELMKLYSETYSNNLFVYNYDELVINPDVQIRKIIAWLGWEWSEKYLSPHKSKRSVFTASSEQVRNPIYTKSLHGWKKYRDLLEPAFPLISKNEELKRYLDN